MHCILHLHWLLNCFKFTLIVYRIQFTHGCCRVWTTRYSQRTHQKWCRCEQQDNGIFTRIISALSWFIYTTQLNFTALILASRGGYIAVVQFLLSKKADVHQRTNVYSQISLYHTIRLMSPLSTDSTGTRLWYLLLRMVTHQSLRIYWTTKQRSMGRMRYVRWWLSGDNLNVV